MSDNDNRRAIVHNLERCAKEFGELAFYEASTAGELEAVRVACTASSIVCMYQRAGGFIAPTGAGPVRVFLGPAWPSDWPVRR